MTIAAARWRRNGVPALAAPGQVARQATERGYAADQQEQQAQRHDHQAAHDQEAADLVQWQARVAQQIYTYGLTRETTRRVVAGASGYPYPEF